MVESTLITDGSTALVLAQSSSDELRQVSRIKTNDLSVSSVPDTHSAVWRSSPDSCLRCRLI